MKLTGLFQMQRVLDTRIVSEHPIKQGENRVIKKLLALQVEIGEWINELPETFKYWSNKKNKREESLKEYVDGLHFILSIGLELGVNEEIDFDYTYVNLPDRMEVELNCLYGGVSELFKLYVATLVNPPSTLVREDMLSQYEKLVNMYLALGVKVGYSTDEIVDFYLKKNEENHERQNNNY
ncbi:hypothetical protein COF68_06380 [Bacillus toyonensis]|uniref:dUTP diphosphatase n=1 Tax=Bacillus toyonensis TaxID=155322 RepID=UPI000BFDB0D7|nr:dUTP diphosphatase [Bacillus toyonensis]PHE64461.1 hypothetical protein COF68_06380 [Bacillus toyonensis]